MFHFTRKINLNLETKLTEKLVLRFEIFKSSDNNFSFDLANYSSLTL